MGFLSRKRKYRRWGKEQVLEELRGWKKRYGRAPTAREVSPLLLSAAVRHFGSWARAKKEAGLEIYPPGRKASR